MPAARAIPDQRSALAEHRRRVRVRAVASRVVLAIALVTLLALARHRVWRSVLFLDQVTWDIGRNAARPSIVLAAICLLVAARGLRRGHRLAWGATVALLGVSGVLHLVHRLDVIAAVLVLGAAAWLATQRRAFPVLPSAMPAPPDSVQAPCGSDAMPTSVTVCVRLDLVASVDGHTAVVSGAASGIGRALALRLGRHGCALALTDWDAAGLAETAGLVDSPVLCRVLDVRDRDAQMSWADDVVGWAPTPIGVVVNNAGVVLTQWAAEADYDDEKWLMDVNFWGVAHGTRAFLPHLISQRSGAVVNMSQISARRDAKSHAAQQHWLAERLLDRSAFRTTHLRPTFFAEWLKWQWRREGEQGLLRLPFGRGRHAPIAGRDQAAVIAAVLQTPAPHDRQI